MNSRDLVRQRFAAAFKHAGEPTAMSTPGASPMDRAPASRRKKLWELDAKHHCPIIGTCLPLPELRKLARRFDFGGPQQDEFSLHVGTVGFAATRNPVAEFVHRHLDRLYGPQIRRFDQAKSDAEVRALWTECYARGEIAGPLWAALTHRTILADTRDRIYADVHMLSHQIGAGQAADARQLAHLASENRSLLARLEREQRERAQAEGALRGQISTLDTELVRLRAEVQDVAEMRARLTSLESGAAMVDMGRRLLSLTALNEQLRAAAERAGQLDTRFAALARELHVLQRERDELTRERDALERMLLAPLADQPGCESECGACEHSSSSRILCVGGRAGLVHHYRILAQRLGIRLIHHDGGKEEALSRLPEMIHGADAVLCPTDCVSHSAYYQVKQHCKRSGKPCLLFKGAGVSSFAVALQQLASGGSSMGRPGQPGQMNSQPQDQEER